MAKSISKKIQKHLSQSLADYFDPDAFFILGVSGGLDSMALLYLFHLLEREALVVHINYGKRGKQADKDQELVEQLAFQWGFECCSIRLNPKEAEGENFQNWARKQRYQFFRDLKSDSGAEAIVTAHHQDDQVETILQKLFRGSGPAAWQGMREWDGKLFRPLLNFDKEDILAFCEAEAIPYRTDESNQSSDYARNFIRNEFAQQMDSLLPGWKQNILNLPEQGKLFEASITEITEQVTNNNSINLKKYAQLPQILKPAVLKTLLDQFGLEGVYSKGQLEALTELEFLQPGKSMKVGDLVLTRERGGIHLQKNESIDEISQKISKKIAHEGYSLNGITLKKTKKPSGKAALKLDASKLSWPLTLRSWSDGDALQPLGMAGHQKVSDHLTNRKIPSHFKEKALVLCGSDSTIYAILYPVPATNNEQGAISELAKCESTSTTFLTINFS
ncbi:tRNA lysidine(34) synthetase TilS [Gracilimonas sp.]|uniref:tRNA lysidine(34) synthetase TilS n=1 Tax=Gracilimonas sp. TaxID=1974203 RepID=UPI003D0BCE12